MPAFLTRTVEVAISIQPVGDFHYTGPLEVFSVDVLDDFGFLRHDYQMLILVLGIAEEAGAADLNLSLLVAILQAKLHVLRKALAFVLSEGRHNREQHLALQAVQWVMGEPADGLGDNHVDATRHAFVE